MIQKLLTLPSIGVSLLPKLACPLCWPAYASLLSSVGLGVLLSTAYLFPITAFFLAVTVGVLGFGARQRGGYGPLILGLGAAATVLLGKFRLDANPVVMHGAVGLLVIASVWNAWPRPVAGKAAPCPSCTLTGIGTVEESAPGENQHD